MIVYYIRLPPLSGTSAPAPLPHIGPPRGRPSPEVPREPHCQHDGARPLIITRRISVEARLTL